MSDKVILETIAYIFIAGVMFIVMGCIIISKVYEVWDVVLELHERLKKLEEKEQGNDSSTAN